MADWASFSDTIMSLTGGTNDAVKRENANKNATLLSTQRDLMAGEASKAITLTQLLPARVAQAHQAGDIHVHDLDYRVSPHITNCCVANFGDMLMNGTVMNDKAIRTPQSIGVACTVLSQLIAQIASAQYGGQTVNRVDELLAPFAQRSYLKHVERVKDGVTTISPTTNLDDPMVRERIEHVATQHTRKDIRDGIQTLTYQISSLMTTNGQAPFVTLSMNTEPGHSGLGHWEDAIIQEILSQRIEGIEDSNGVKTTLEFPKLIFVLHEDSFDDDNPRRHLTRLAAECTAKRMYPDYISATNMKQTYGGLVFAPMGCRSFLPPLEIDGQAVIEGRFNKGVTTLNLPRIALRANGDKERFWTLLTEMLDVVREATFWQHNRLMGTPAKVAPILWQYGGIARLEPDEVIDPYLGGGYSTISLGYIGLDETVRILSGKSMAHPEGRAIARAIFAQLEEARDQWNTTEQGNIGVSIYGTPSESLTDRFARVNNADFDHPVTSDHDWITNSFHIDVREPIDAFTKLRIESEFAGHSTGGNISYVELPNLTHNVEAVEAVMRCIDEHSIYGEINLRADHCAACGFDGECVVDENDTWSCPACHNADPTTLSIVRRVCGYLGSVRSSGNFNHGKAQEMRERVLHL